MYTHLAPVYDALMRPAASPAAWAGFVLAHCENALGRKPQTLCDAACGTGLIALEAAKRGISAIGADNSPAMLTVAADKARKAMVNVPFICQPLQKLELHKPADAVTCACDGVNYLLTENDLESFFESAYNALNDGGVLVFDISTSHKLKNVLGNNTFFVDDESNESASYVWEGQFDNANQTLQIDLTLFIKNNDNLYTKHHEHHTQKAWSPEQIKSKLSYAGFVLHSEFGDDFVAPPTLESLRHHFIAKKPEDQT
ncbi:MAG: class I SAM-dependent methyltransferase [Clostridia bacterium]|nr:class I SAM-dependent methyltransferase [Clostridia bacterium]